ncbi:MAG: hypothetical protein OQL19_07200, partial [Gammaproteobacteria bacterium]|nr:hypothetical protein [Gammaproteobacteria bacterium]
TRVAVQQFFDEQKLRADQIIQVKTVSLPARVIAYQYYGESTKGFDLANLNEDANNSFLNGNIEVFTK